MTTRVEFSRSEQDAFAEYLSKIPEYDRMKANVHRDWAAKNESSGHTWESWKDHFRRSGKEYIEKKIIHFERKRAQKKRERKEAAAAAQGSARPPIAGPSNANNNDISSSTSKSKKRLREPTTEPPEEEEEVEKPKSNKRAIYTQKDKGFLALALRKAINRGETKSSAYDTLAKKYPAHSSTSWQTFYRDNAPEIEELIEDAEIEVKANREEAKKRKAGQITGEDSTEKNDTSHRRKSTSSSAQPPERKKVKKVESKPIVVSSESEEESEEKQEKKRQEDKGKEKELAKEVATPKEQEVAPKAVYVGFSGEDDEHLTTAIAKAETANFPIETCWSTLARLASFKSLYPTHPEAQWERRWKSNMDRLKPIVVRKITALAKNSAEVQAAVVSQAIVPNIVSTLAVVENPLQVSKGPLASLRTENTVEEDLDELADDSQFDSPLQSYLSRGQDFFKNTMEYMGVISPHVPTNTSPSTSIVRTPQQKLSTKVDRVLPTPIILSTPAILSEVGNKVVPLVTPGSSAQSLPSPYIKSFKPPQIKAKEIRIEMEVDDSEEEKEVVVAPLKEGGDVEAEDDDEVRTELMDEDDRRIEATLNAVPTPAALSVLPSPSLPLPIPLPSPSVGLETGIFSTLLSTLTHELKPKSRPIQDKSSFLAELSTYDPLPIPASLIPTISHDWDQPIPALNWNPRVLALAEFTSKQSKLNSSTTATSNETLEEEEEEEGEAWPALTKDAIEVEVDLLQSILVEKKFQEEEKLKKVMDSNKVGEKREWEKKEAEKAFMRKKLVAEEEKRFKLEGFKFDEGEKLRIEEVQSRIAKERMRLFRAKSDELAKMEEDKKKAVVLEEARVEQSREKERVRLLEEKQEVELAEQNRVAKIHREKQQEEAIRKKMADEAHMEGILKKESIERARSLQAQNEARVLQDQNSSQEKEKRRLVKATEQKSTLSQSTRSISPTSLLSKTEPQIHSSSPAPPPFFEETQASIPLPWTTDFSQEAISSPALPSKRPRASVSASVEPSTSVSSHTLLQGESSPPPRHPKARRLRSPFPSPRAELLPCSRPELVAPTKESVAPISDSTDPDVTIKNLKRLVQTYADKYKIKWRKAMKLYFACSANTKDLDLALQYYTTTPRPKNLEEEVLGRVWSYSDDVAVLEGSKKLKLAMEEKKGRGSVATRKAFLNAAGRTTKEHLGKPGWPFEKEKE